MLEGRREEVSFFVLPTLCLTLLLTKVGLLVVDEVHMVGEKGGRGSNLEALITKVTFSGVSGVKNWDCYVQVKHVNYSSPAKERIQVIAMSATVGNLKELSTFLDAELFTKDFRPVQLVEHLVIGTDVLEVRGTGAYTNEER